MKKEEGIKVLNLVVENFKNIEKTEVDFMLCRFDEISFAAGLL